MTSWIFEGNGVIEEFVGGYHDAQQQKKQALRVPTGWKAIKARKWLRKLPKLRQLG